MGFLLKCRSCTSTQISRSHRRGFTDELLSLFGFMPYRCNECDHRFHARNPKGPTHPEMDDAPRIDPV